MDHALVDVSSVLPAMYYPSTDAAWFALHVRAKSEPLVSSVLRRKGFQTFSPVYLERRKYSDRIKQVETALFPGYVFCRFAPADPLPIITTPAVHRILTVGNKPAPVSAGELDGIRRAADAGLASPAPYLTAGQKVRVDFGPMAGVEGLVVSLKGDHRLILNVETLHRAVAVHVDLDHVTAL